MTARTRKWVHAGLIALASSVGETATQLLNGHFQWERTVLAGTVMLIFSRVMGAALAAIALNEDKEPPDGQS